MTIQDVDQSNIKYISHDITEPNWVAPDGPLRVPESKGNRRAGNGGRKCFKKNRLLDDILSHILIYQISTQTKSLSRTVILYSQNVLAADFKREYKNIEFLWKQRPGVGGMNALLPAASHIPGKYLCFLVTKATDRQHVNPESLVLALTRLRDFLIKRRVTG